MNDLLHDIRLAGRSLRRSPGFTTVALLTLALGIGANAAMFSIVDGVLLRPLPYPEPGELVRVHQASLEEGVFQERFSPVDFEDWREQTRSFEAMAAYLHGPQILAGAGGPTEIWGAFVTADFFRVLRVPAQVGRTLGEEDARLAARRAVVSDRLWRTYLDADAGAVGRTLVLEGESFTVVGVMPPGFSFPTPETDVWMPHSLLTEMHVGASTRDNRYLEGVARLADGVGVERAQAELAGVVERLAAQHPETNAGWGGATLVPLRTAIVGDVDRALVVVLGVVGFILLIGCANLANLLLARASTRSREIAVRTALGAGWKPIVRQLLIESSLLALLGGALGLLLSAWWVQAVVALSADTLPRLEEIRVDGRVIGFTFALSLVTGTLFGLLPALRSVRIDPQEALRGVGGVVGRSGQGLRSGLVIAEVALAVVLVIGAGLMARSFLELRSVDPGFDPDGVLTVSMQLDIAGVPVEEVGSHLVQRREEVIERVRALPGVSEVGTINAFPLRGEGGPLFELERIDRDGTPSDGTLRAEVQYVNPGYFRAMGIRLLRGGPLPDDLPGGGAVPMLVSETAAQRFWPGEEPVGQRADAGWAEVVVVGVVGDVRGAGLSQEPVPAVYFPQKIAPRSLATLAVRTAGDPLALAEPVRQVIHGVDPNLVIREVAPLGGVLAESLARDRFFTSIFAVFGALALVLAALGIYGVLAYSISRRTQEIAVRMALGAGTGDVLRREVGAGMLLVAAGVALGTFGALLLTGLLESQLYGVGAADPATYGVSLGVLAAVTLAASYFPARRATRVDPLVALRMD